MVRSLLNNVYSLGLGAAVTSKEQIEKAVDELVKKGEIRRSESSNLVDELVEKGSQTQKQIEGIVQERVKQVLDSMHIATKEEVAALERRIRELEQADPK
ncbi:phasin family protein [Alkalicoccobacillus murimartini]|uniref:Polyhydroxyalkanoate synthesis regulator phasin n=1 Tax=Alkalicoccobacillus murimartini TaxID=171685 RepID=A0ABT9YDC9_9BACI|nr:phasin family protein [Alkalicoccobacillus murimartini]MDQ0205850.1 polyhydroxyalkanoate synthesis regulator phasin [Alkalicoccobacillus murimartini]